MGIGRNDIIAARSVQNYSTRGQGMKSMTELNRQYDEVQRRDDEIQARQDAENTAQDAERAAAAL